MMSPKGRKCSRSLPPDFLSNLPDNIINVILMCLPFKEAVRTSILSKKWRYNWCRLTEWELDESLWVKEKDQHNPTVKFRKIIYQLLTLHEGPITKFTLDIGRLQRCPKIDNFIYFLSRNGIQHLVLDLPGNDEYRLPSSFFSCLQLRRLILRNCLIEPPSAFQGFDKLISLQLYEVTVSSEVLSSLISHCPLLDELVLDIYEYEGTIEISGPMLTGVSFSGDLSTICLKNVPRLVKVFLTGDYIRAEDLDFAKVFESCPALEILRFSFYNFEILAEAQYVVPTRLPFDLNRVKGFYLPNMMLSEKSCHLPHALCLIRSFPCLVYLEIQVCYEIEEDDCTLECLEFERFTDVTFNHLRGVRLLGCGGTEPELQLVKLLSAKSPVLERIIIDRRAFDVEHLYPRKEIFAKVSTFKCASSKAEVYYVDRGGSWTSSAR